MPRTDHDSSFRLLFSDPRVVRDFFIGFVDSELGKLLDWSTLQTAAARHADEGLKQSENGMIWGVRMLGGDGPVVYIMLEFQSQPDWTMALRMLNYAGQFSAKLAKLADIRQQQQLPTVLSAVLYNGEAEWTSAPDVGNLVPFVPPGWEAQCPRMAHRLVDVFRGAVLDRSERNLADAIFRLQRAGALEAPGEVRWLKQWLVGKEWATLRRNLMEWIMEVLLPWRMPGMSARELGDLRDLDGLEAAMTTWIEEWKAAGRVEGRAEGRAEGRIEGRVEGQAGTLVRMARKRFGESAASTVAALLESVTSEAALDEIETCLLTCANGDALIAKVRQI